MSSTYSTNLAIELIGTGDQSGAWGTTTNNNLGTLLEQAISGYVTQAITDGADTVLTMTPGLSATARNIFIECTGALTAARNLVVPANKKLYFIYNNTSGGYAVTVKVSGQTGVLVANGSKVILVCNGTDVVNATSYLATTSTLSVSSGGTGVATLTGVAYGNGTSAFTAATGAQIVSAIGATAVTNATNATSATTATNIAGGTANQIAYQTGVGATGFLTAPSVVGSYLGWNGSALTWSTISTTTPNAATFNDSGSGDASGTSFNGAVARTISYNTVGAPSTTGTNATGTWGINISGNAATVTNGLTTSNYNSYSPTLTGTGASGTWGISISGNAAGLSSTLVVGSGGTGATTLSGVVYGNGTSAFTAATGAQIASAIGSSTVTNATNSANLVTTNFSIIESGGKLLFKYGGTTLGSLDSSGNLIVIGNVTANGTP